MTKKQTVPKSQEYALSADFWNDEEPHLPAVQSNYVAPERVRRPTQVQILPPEAPMVQPASMIESRVHGSYQDRARGFNLVALPLAGGVGVGSLIVGLVGFSVPIVSVAALAWLWSGFLLTWLIAWGLHLLFSPDGVSLLHTASLWGYLRREQAERWAFYHRQFDDDQER